MKDGFIKAAALTPQIRVADPAYNAEQVIQAAVEADLEGVRLMVFPELCLVGYTAGDLLYQETLLSAAQSALRRVAEGTSSVGAILFVGLPGSGRRPDLQLQPRR